jgi:hypothetical protein
MSEAASASLVFVLLLAFAGIGVMLRPFLPEEHKAHETVQLVTLVIGMLVTFASLVLGLLTASAKSSFDTVGNDLRDYASELIQLDQQLRDYGRDADDTRALLRAYTAAVIASTWPAEPRPPGNYYPIEPASNQLESVHLGQMLDSAGREIRHLAPQDEYHHRLADDILASFNQLGRERWKVIEEARAAISLPFFVTLTFWLIVIFLSFGLVAPRNALALVTILLGALSIASAVYVIVDLQTPLTGSLIISSHSMRDALAHLSR